MAKRRSKSVRVSRAKVSDDDRTIYTILREEFTAADLQKYTEIEPLIPAEQVVKELESAAVRKRSGLTHQAASSS